MTARGDARKRQANSKPTPDFSETGSSLTKAERKEMERIEDTGDTQGLAWRVARIKAEAVQAERERIIEWLESAEVRDFVCIRLTYFDSAVGPALAALAAHAKGEAL